MPNTANIDYFDRIRIRNVTIRKFSILCIFVFIVMFGVILISLSRQIYNNGNPILSGFIPTALGIITVALGLVGVLWFILIITKVNTLFHTAGQSSSPGENTNTEVTADGSGDMSSCARANGRPDVVDLPDNYFVIETISGTIAREQYQSPAGYPHRLPEYEFPPSYEEAIRKLPVQKGEQ